MFGAKDKIITNIKLYGVPFLIFECVTYTLTAAVFYVLFSTGLQMADLLAFADLYLDVNYYTDLLGIERSHLTGNASKLVLSIIGAELVGPLKLPLELPLFLYMVKKGWIKKRTPKQREAQ